MDAYNTPVDDSPPTTLTKTPTYEYYGFVLYLVSGITYGQLATDRKKNTIRLRDYKGQATKQPTLYD